jgi:hypothetical protein
MGSNARHVRRGPGPSSTLITPDRAGNVVGVDPHKRTLTATVVDPRGGIVSSEHFRVSGDGHRALEAWAEQFGPVVRSGIEGASGWGRHTAIFLVGRGQDVRDVCPNRTGRQDRARQRGKSDMLDSERVARETLAHALLPRAFKRARDQAGPDEQTELLSVWWNARCSLLKSRQHLLSEAEALLRGLPIELIERLPDSKAVRPRLRALATVTRRRRSDPPTGCGSGCWASTAPRSPSSTHRTSRSRASWRRWCTPVAARSSSCAACRPCRSRNCWSRSVTPAGSPKAGSRALTAPRRWSPLPVRGRASRSATASTPAVTGA